jgi:hypothetical protein
VYGGVFGPILTLYYLRSHHHPSTYLLLKLLLSTYTFSVYLQPPPSIYIPTTYTTSIYLQPPPSIYISTTYTTSIYLPILRLPTATTIHLHIHYLHHFYLHNHLPTYITIHRSIYKLFVFLLLSPFYFRLGLCLLLLCCTISKSIFSSRISTL